jgi:branched-chain amino acid aminotransferase
MLTPPLGDGALAGVTRSLLVELGAGEQSLWLHDVLAADEAFLSATSLPARALVALDGRPIADGQPGPRTAELAASFAVRARALLGEAV